MSEVASTCLENKPQETSEASSFIKALNKKSSWTASQKIGGYLEIFWVKQEEILKKKEEELFSKQIFWEEESIVIDLFHQSINKKLQTEEKYI